MTIIGLGIDILKIKRIKNIVNKFGHKFSKKILSKKELKKLLTIKKKTNFIAKKFSVKESISKALGTGFRNKIKFTSFEILHDKLGKPYVKLLNKAKIFAFQLNLKSIHISITDEKKYICSVAILEKK
ncbi:holo-ACP synthase [Buchnera aphidicola]|uniref:holo-ACP synthase n=1 Tax=Buchnera aphidicola TaxID=9 RepID=UPI00346487F6